MIASSPRSQETFTPSWDTYSLGIISLFFILQIARWQLFPLFIDAYYHMSVVQGFDKAGGYVSNNFWEYAPVGRPHLYPPLLHILILLFYKTGLSKIFILRLFDCVIFPASLVTLWYIIRNLFNKRMAFFAVLIAASIPSLYLSLIVTSSASLSAFSALWGFYFLEREKRVAGTVLLIFSFYSHGLVSWVFVSAFLIYKAFDRKNLIRYIRAISIAILAALPLLIHQYLNRSYFRFRDVNENYQLEINILLILLAIGGAFVSFRRKGRYYFSIALFLGFLVLAVHHRYRYFSGLGLLGFLFLAAGALNYIYEKIQNPAGSATYLAGVILLFFVFSPTLDVTGKTISFDFFNSTVANLINISGRPERANEKTIFFPKHYDEIIKVIRDNSSEDDIIYSNTSYFAGALGVLSGRATSSAMLMEIRPRRSFDPVRAAKLIIWLKDPDAPENEPYPLINNYGLDKIKDTELAFIYENNSADTKRAILDPVVPTPVLFSAFFILLSLVIMDVFRRRLR